MGIEIIGYIVIAWFAGIIGADYSKPNFPTRNSGDLIYQYRKICSKKVIVSYHADGQSTCRPQIYMSGTFKDGVLRPMVPWPFRRGKYFESRKKGTLDSCTGEVFYNGKWVALEDNIETPFWGEIK